jgi:hypothetical protein
MHQAPRGGGVQAVSAALYGLREQAALEGGDVAPHAQSSKIAEVSYMFPRPGPDKRPVQKVAYVTKVGDQVCLVGYYK